jgi:UPF0716 protein FxsA
VFVPIVLALIVASLVEIWVIVQVGQAIGAPATLLLLLASAVLGGWLLRREGAKTWSAFTTALQERRPPAAEVVDGMLVLIGGLLMMLPGFVSDVVGLLLVLPPTRRLVRGVVLLRLASRLPAGVLGPLRVRSRRTPGAPAGQGRAPEPPVPGGTAQDGTPRVLEGQIVQDPSPRRRDNAAPP